MKTTLKIILCAVGMTILTITAASAQKNDSTHLRNTVKLDLTSYGLYRNAVVFSYERIVKKKPYQTWGITVGYQQFPSSISFADTVRAGREFKASGFKTGAEYRFYLKKENKYPAPRGVFIGPYVSYHNYVNGRSFAIDNNGTVENVDLKTKLNIFNIGVQFGYQFVIKNRWAIDLSLIGPSISRYSFKAALDGNYSFDSEDITNEVVLKMMDRFPAFDKLVSGDEITANGKASTWSYGWRYQVQVGYRFDKRKK